MSNVNVPRLQGDDYQARWFWIQICRLFTEPHRVKTVIYEANNIKSFDDVVVVYKEGTTDHRGEYLYADYYQVKFHVSPSGSITWQALIDPNFINASRFSLLQRLKNAQVNHSDAGYKCRYFLYSPWNIHPDDPLANVISLNDGSLKLEKLADGGDQSEMGLIRSAWRNHLEVQLDDELYNILSSFHVRVGPILDDLNRELNNWLMTVGLRPMNQENLIHVYDELTRKLLLNGIREFDREKVEAICRKEGLWAGYSISEPDASRIGIRSFARWADHLEDSTDSFLSLLDLFDGRAIRSPDLWNSEVVSRLFTFLTSSIQNRSRRYHLLLSAHSSIAFAAGHCLHSKAGLDVVPIQQSASGNEVWRPVNPLNEAEFVGLVDLEQIVTDDGPDIAVALSITNEISGDVAFYVEQYLPQVRRIVTLTLSTGTNSRAILNGSHASILANQLARYLKTQRTSQERMGVLHIFTSAPNSMLFFLGQQSHGFGRCILYEYMFESNLPGAYEPSIAFNF